ncbi:MAG: ABC transporter permease, partial [Acidobacteriota bacterium]
MRDLRYACRLLVSRPGFTLATVLSLALGIGANVTIFSFINEVFLRPLPITAPDRVMAIHTSDKKIGDTQALSHLNWKDLREANETFVGIAGYDWTPMSVSTAGEPIHVVGQLVSGNYFDVLGVRAALGRTFLAEEDATLNTHPVAVLSHYFWSRRLGADPDIVGQTLEINAYPFTVIGVAPPEFKGLELGVQPELWVPMMMNPVIQPATVGLWYETRRGLFVYSFGRLEPGVTQGNAAADLKTIAARLEREYPDVNKNRSVRIEPVVRAAIAPWARDGVTRGSALMMAAAVLVLLIVCANVANLLLA